MSKENNVAAQADHSEPRERSPYVLGVKPSTWDAQIAAQAGDEQMPSALTVKVHHSSHGATVVVNIKRGETVTQLYAQDHDADCETLGWQILPRGFEVSPRATADVERELIRSIIEDGYLSDTNTARGHEILATTKPGA